MASRPGQLALRPGVGLQRHGVVAGDLAQRALEVGDQLAVAVGLGGGGERVDRGELGPRHRLHLGGGVELHRARAQRDHRPVEGHVAVGQLAQVAQHLGLGAVLVEHRVGEELAGAGLVGREAHGVAGGGVVAGGRRASRRRGRARRRRRRPGGPARRAWSSRRARGRACRRRTRRRLTPGRGRPLDQRRRLARRPDGQRVEPRLVDQLVAAGQQAERQRRGEARGCAGRCAVRPSGPWYTAYIEAMTASSTWAVQMLEVAFSRRMCCSRVCRASR